MKKINVLLLDEQDKILREFQKESNIICLDEAVNKLILIVKNYVEDSK